MKFLDLRLLAYGPFRDLTLDFSAPGARMHVLHGRNEAGKSTTLRAVMGLLYGIPKITPDAHLHAMTDLRIGGRLKSSDGTTLDIVRRKGTKNTLLGPNGELIDEAMLKRVLGNVGEEVYRTTFGLNHETLREGGKSLLLGKGDLGESLFQASLGGSEVHQVLAQLRAEADAIFTARAHTRPLNDALRTHLEAQKKQRDSAQSAESWVVQTEAIETAKADLLARTRERTELILEQKKAQRTRRVSPILGKRAHLRAQREALGDVVDLPAKSSGERIDALREKEQARGANEKLGREVLELEARRAKLLVPDSLIDEGEAVQAIHDRLGAHKKAALDHPGLRGGLERSEDDARRVLQRIGRDLPLDQAEALRLDAATQARIRRLARESARLEDQLTLATRALSDAEAQLARTRAKSDSLDPPRDAEPLRRAVDRAQQQGDLEERARSERARVQKLEEAALAKQRALGLWSGSLDDAPGLPVPSIESVERFAKGDAARALEEAQLEARGKELRSSRSEMSRELNALLGGGVPSEDELSSARAHRDQGWLDFTEAWREGKSPPSTAMAAAYEQRVREADALADRLRREAERVTRLARLRADEMVATAEEARLTDARAALSAREKEESAAWRALWEPAAVVPLPPAEMRAWLTRHAALVVAVEQVRAARVDQAQLDARIAAHRDEMAGAILAVREPPFAAAEDLSARVGRALRVLAVIETNLREHRETADASAAQGKELQRCARDRDAAASARAQWKEEWAAAVAPLGLDAAVAAEEAAAVTDELVELLRCLDDAAKTRRRITSIERDAAIFARDVAALATRHAPDLASLGAEDAASRIYERYQRGSRDRALRAQHDDDLEAKRRAAVEHAEVSARADATLRSLMRAAHVESLDALEEAERRAATAQALLRDIAATEEQLHDAGEGATVDELVREAALHGSDEVSARLDALEARLRELEDEIAKGHTTVARCLFGLEKMSGESGAADAAAEAQEALARVRRHVERYVRVRLASIVLGGEIDRYREKNQAPVLGLASAFFSRLTLGGYGGLRAGFDARDQAVLRAVRADGREVDVEGLSDGTRDQLYLALRLASLELHGRTNETIPLVFDDVLIHFDDDRARAALQILGELAMHTQVLFFTHHARLVSLAREALPATILGVHELERPGLSRSEPADRATSA